MGCSWAPVLNWLQATLTSCLLQVCVTQLSADDALPWPHPKGAVALCGPADVTSTPCLGVKAGRACFLLFPPPVQFTANPCMLPLRQGPALLPGGERACLPACHAVAVARCTSPPPPSPASHSQACSPAILVCVWPSGKGEARGAVPPRLPARGGDASFEGPPMCTQTKTELLNSSF